MIVTTQSSVSIVDLSKDFCNLKSLVKRNSSLKILAINAENYIQMKAAIVAGACGSTLKGVSKKTLELVTAAIEQDYLLKDTKSASFLVFPKSQITQYFSFLQNKIIKDLILFWRTKSFPYQVTIINVIQELEITNLISEIKQNSFNISAVEELNRVILSLSCNSRNNNLERAITNIENQLSSWYFGNKNNITEDYLKEDCSFLKRVKDNTLLLKDRSINKLKIIQDSWSDTGCKTILNLVKDLIVQLQIIEKKFELEYHVKFQEGASAQNAYFNLSSKLLKNKKNFEYCLRALAIQYKNLVDTQIIRGVISIVSELIQQLHSYYNSLQAIDKTLLGISQTLNHSKNILSSVYWNQNKPIIASKILREIENELKLKLHNWDLLSIEESCNLHNKLFQKTTNITKKNILDWY